MLVVGACVVRKDQKEEQVIKQYFLNRNTEEHILENEKKFVRYFGKLVLSVDFKPRRGGQ